jgi:DNA-binding NtrC family response regulator
VARIIHYNGPRQAGPFVTLHCGSLPESLLESELFGHDKNAFTGAIAEKTGHLERAAGGTLFLDEIGEVPLSVQTRLLRFVEDSVFTRVGGREDRRIDVRLITATNRDLRHEVKRGRFREDLYFRLRVLEIAMPPIEQRREDIPLLCSFFLGGMAPGRNLTLSPAALKLLQDYPWPGNVRELRNAIEHAVTVSSGDTIRPEHLPREILSARTDGAGKGGLQDRLDRWLTMKIADGATYDDIHQEMESFLLSNLLARFKQKPTLMARALKMNRSTLLAKRRRQQLRREESESKSRDKGQ